MATSAPSLSSALQGICGSLAEIGAPFALVGGLAVSVRAEPRLTRDVDVAVRADTDSEAESFIRKLVARGYRIESTVEQERTGRLATVRMIPRGGKLFVDILFASSGIEAEITRDAETIEILPALRVPVAIAPHLVAMKLLAADDRERPQDIDDLRALVPLLDARARKRVVEALDLISKRGFARGRDLRAAWRALSRRR